MAAMAQTWATIVTPRKYKTIKKNKLSFGGPKKGVSFPWRDFEGTRC